jgi:CRISPR/Cas system CSM-associated protein Csm2 small subunit
MSYIFFLDSSDAEWKHLYTFSIKWNIMAQNNTKKKILPVEGLKDIQVFLSYDDILDALLDNKVLRIDTEISIEDYQRDDEKGREYREHIHKEIIKTKKGIKSAIKRRQKRGEKINRVVKHYIIKTEDGRVGYIIGFKDTLQTLLNSFTEEGIGEDNQDRQAEE